MQSSRFAVALWPGAAGRLGVRFVTPLGDGFTLGWFSGLGAVSCPVTVCLSLSICLSFEVLLLRTFYFGWLSLQDWSLLGGICHNLLFLRLNTPRDAGGRHMLSVNERNHS